MKLLALALCVATPSLSQTVCDDYAQFSAFLQERYQEEVRTIGLFGNHAVVQFANEDTGSWTIMVVSPDGTACIVAVGEAWQYHEPTPRGVLN